MVQGWLSYPTTSEKFIPKARDSIKEPQGQVPLTHCMVESPRPDSPLLASYGSTSRTLAFSGAECSKTAKLA